MQTLTELVNEQAHLPAQRRAAQLAGDGDTLIRLADREKQLDLLIETARTKQQADQLRQEIAALEAQAPALAEAATAARTALDTASHAVDAWRAQERPVLDAFATAQRDHRNATGTAADVQRQIREKQAQLRTLYQTEPATPPAPRPTYQRTSEPLTGANAGPHMAHLTGQMPADTPARSFVVTADGITPNDGRPVVTDRRA